MPSLPEAVWKRRLEREYQLMQESGNRFSCDSRAPTTKSGLRGRACAWKTGPSSRKGSTSLRLCWAGTTLTPAAWPSAGSPPSSTRTSGRRTERCAYSLLNAWSAEITVASLVNGIAQLLQNPNPNDPLNKPAADYYSEHPQAFLEPRRRKRRCPAVPGLYLRDSAWF